MLSQEQAIIRDILLLKGGSTGSIFTFSEHEAFLLPENILYLVEEIARTGTCQRSSFLAYACDCFEKCNTTQLSGKHQERGLKIIEEIKKALFNVTQMVLAIPDEFTTENPRCQAQFLKYLQADKLMKNFPSGFLSKLLSGLDWIDLKNLIKPTYDYLLKSTMIQREALGVSLIMHKLYTQIPCIETLLVNPSWLPSVRVAKDLENKNLFLKLISFRADNWSDDFNKKLFKGFKELPPLTQRKNIDTFRATMNQVQNVSFQIFKKCLSKQLAQHRDRAIEILSLVARMNKDKRKMRYNPNMLSSDGMLANLSFVMLKLTLPILNGKNKKDGTSRMSNINCLIFVLENGVVDYSNVSRINASQEILIELKEKHVSRMDVEFNLMTKMFVLGLEILHIGLLRSIKNMKTIRQNIWRNQRINTPQSLNKAQMLGMRYAASVAHYLDPKILKEALTFYTLVGKWILNLSKTDPESCNVLPEYIFEDIITIFTILNDNQNVKRECDGFYSEESLLTFCIQLLKPGSPCQNVHHRIMLVNVITMFVPNGYENTSIHNYINHLLNTAPDAHELIPLLMILYIKVEDGDYEQRYAYRYHLANILKFLWNYDLHNRAMHTIWNEEPNTFVRMLNMLINDNICLVDSALEMIGNLHELETSENQDEENRASRENLQSTLKQKNQLALVQLELLCWLSSNIQKPFFDKRILDRIATMIDVYLKKLTQETATLNVSSNEAIDFKPRQLLTSIATIFLNLGNHSEEFLTAIGKDAAFYCPKSYTKAIKIMNKHNLLPTNLLIQLQNLSKQIEAIQKEHENIETKLGEIPDKYLDPILYTLMRDPVRLPTNDMIMDRAKIEINILNTGQCPFTRKPLTKEELIPVPELKAEIEAWIEERLASFENDEN